MRGLTVIGLLLSALAAPAAAQDANAQTNFGEVRLRPGFQPDPALFPIQAGGAVDASTRFEGCRGFISEAPDMRLFWDGTGSLPLRISAMSNADVTLVVNGPDGAWRCDDDGGEDSNPSLQLNAVQGRYEIWVGTYALGLSKSSVVSISELRSF